MWLKQACEALNQRKCLEITYDGYSRVVEVHAAGYSKKDEGIMRVWQVRGGSSSGESQGWKLMHLDEALSAKIIDEDSLAPRRGYKRGDPAIANLVCQI